MKIAIYRTLTAIAHIVQPSLTEITIYGIFPVL